MLNFSICERCRGDRCGAVQADRRKCNERLAQLSGQRSDVHQEGQARASDKKRLQQQLNQIRAVATKRIQVGPAIVVGWLTLVGL